MDYFDYSGLGDIANEIMKDSISCRLEEDKGLKMTFDASVKTIRFRYTFFFGLSLYLPFILFLTKTFISGLILTIIFTIVYVKFMLKTKDKAEMLLKKAKKNPNISIEFIITNHI